jgi:multiple sugar transport system permease protein
MYRTRQEARDARIGLLLFMPAFLVIALMFFLPVVYELWISFYQSRLYESENPFVGLENYTWLWRSGDLPRSLANTLIWTVGSIIGQSVIGIYLAVLLMKDYPGRGAIRTLLLCTWIMPGVVVGLIWRWIFDPIVGILNLMLSTVGLPEYDWLGQFDTALLCCIIANVWKGVPFWLLMISARLQAIPADLYDAASVDGASPWLRFCHVTVPQIRNIAVLCGILSFIWTFNSFDIIYPLTRGGPDIATTTIPLLIYEIGVRNGHFGEAAATSILFVIAMGGAIALFVRSQLTRPEET